MKITRCKYGHYYDKAYFRECPHCCRARGGRDEDIIIGKNDFSLERASENEPSNKTKNENQGENISQKEKDRKNVERWIGEAWDELEAILNEEDNSSSKNVYEGKKAKETEFKEKIKRQERKGANKEENKEEKLGISEKENNISVEKQCKNSGRNLKGYMLFVTMPLKVIKNQEFCMDFCIFSEEEWETGAKMLSFKSQESIRDLKPAQIELPAKAVLHILYKEEEIFHKEIDLEQEKENIFYTFPVTVTDTRDRRFHMIKAVFEVEEQNIEIPLYLMPNP